MAKKVLVPVDASRQARKAFEFAVEEFEDADVTALHVICPDDPGHLPGIEVKLSTDDEGYAEAVAKEYLKELVAGTDASTGYTRDDSVPRAVIDYADENRFEHIVMGSHGRTGAARVLLGSVAETVVRRAPVPVTIVR